MRADRRRSRTQSARDEGKYLQTGRDSVRNAVLVHWTDEIVRFDRARAAMREQTARELDLRVRGERLVVGRLLVLILSRLQIGADQFLEAHRQVTSQQRLGHGNRENLGEGRCIEAQFEDLRAVRCPFEGRMNRRALTISAPQTPDPRRFGAYSDRSMDRSHSMTRWLDQCMISVMSFLSSGLGRRLMHVGLKPFKRRTCMARLILR